MSFLSAGIALEALALDEKDEGQLHKVGRWIWASTSVPCRWALADVHAAILEASRELRGVLPGESPQAEASPQKGPPSLHAATPAILARLVSNLESADSVSVVAIFDHPPVPEIQLGEVTLGGSSAAVDADRPHDVAHNGQPGFMISVAQGLCGQEAVAQGTERLRQVLGAIYIADALRDNEPSLYPGFGTRFPRGIYVRASDAELRDAPDVRLGGSVRPLDVLSLLNDAASRTIVQVILGHTGPDFASLRIRESASWIQRGFDAISFADAVLAFGVALECVLGDDRGGNTVDTVSRRSGLLLIDAGEPLKRMEVIRRAKHLYDWRSRVAHGRFVPGTTGADELNEVRRAFAIFACQAALAFIERSDAEGWQTYNDFRDWCEIALLT